MTIYEVHTHLATEALKPSLTEDEALVLMVLLHTHRIGLAKAVLADRPSVTELAAITQRDAAEVVANLWRDRADTVRIHYAYWYFQFNTRTPYECVEDIPTSDAKLVEAMRLKFAAHPLIQHICPDD